MKSKVTLLIVLHVLLLLPAAAQDAMPTKEETVNYLNKKAKEVVGRPISDTATNTWESQTVTLKEGRIEIADKSKSGRLHLMTFDPAQITEVRRGRFQSGGDCRTSGTSFLIIRTEPKMVEHDDQNMAVPKSFGSEAILEYVCSPGNVDKITKAIYHLRDLARAEDDLFSN